MEEQVKDNKNEELENINLDELIKTNPEGYAIKISPRGKKIFIDYLNTRPMVEVEMFFVNVFELPDPDPYYKIQAIVDLYDYLRKVCPRGEAKSIIMNTMSELQVYKINPKPEKTDAETVKPNESK